MFFLLFYIKDTLHCCHIHTCILFNNMTHANVNSCLIPIHPLGCPVHTKLCTAQPTYTQMGSLSVFAKENGGMYCTTHVYTNALADLGGGVRDARPPLGVQILSISCSFRENLACSRPPWRVHAPPSGKSWIRH